MESITCKDIFDLSAQGDTLALEIREEYFDFLGQFLANVCCVVDPEAVILGGGVSKAGQPLLDGVRKYFLSIHVPHRAGDCVCPGEAGQ